MKAITASRTRLLLSALLVALTLLFSMGYLDVASRWWFEDDPVQYHHVMGIANPVHLFTDFDVIRGYGAGKAMTPMQLLSYWIDVWLFGPDPAGAYAHNLVALILTVLMIGIMLQRWTGNTAVSISAALLWLIVPTTVAVHYYIAARHYMEGLLCGLVAIFCAEKFVAASRKGEAAFWLSGIVLFSAASMLFKEIYAAMVPVYLLALAGHARKPRLAVIPIALGIGYAAYRTAVHGLDVEYTMPFLGAYDYVRHLLRLPYTLSANHGGYVLVAGLVLVIVRLWKSQAGKPAERTTTVLALLLLAAAFVATYPVAYAILTGYKTPDTSYRMPFIFNTILILWGACVLPRYLPPRRLILAGLLALLIIVPGTERTRRLWIDRMANAEVEGRFYISNPDKLIYSDRDAYWFIIGVHRLYGVAEEHYVSKHFPTGDIERARLFSYPVIWSYQRGTFAPDGPLLENLRKENQIANAP